MYKTGATNKTLEQLHKTVLNR